MVKIAGKYEHESSEGLEEYLKTVGGPSQAEAAKAFAHSKPTLEVVENGDQWVLTVANEGKTATTTFKLGVPYDETMPHGAVLKVRCILMALFVSGLVFSEAICGMHSSDVDLCKTTV